MTKTIKNIPVKKLPREWREDLNENDIVEVTITVSEVVPDSEVEEQKAKGMVSPIFDNTKDALCWLNS